jgi:hypothetical protein
MIDIKRAVETQLQLFDFFFSSQAWFPMVNAEGKKYGLYLLDIQSILDTSCLILQRDGRLLPGVPMVGPEFELRALHL